MAYSFQIGKTETPCECGESVVAVRKGKTKDAGTINCMSCKKER